MISVIVPLHNLGIKSDYCLKRCLDSLLAQTYTNFEVLLMENGSTDDTVDIAQEYCDKDNRFKLHILDTVGVSNARNKGIKLAQGEYITFIDGDDFVSADYLENASYYMVNAKADIIFLPWALYYQHSGDIKHIISFNDDNFLQRTSTDDKKLTSFVCAKFIKSSIIQNKIYFLTDMIIAEDSLFMTEVFFESKNIALVKSGLYLYTQNRKGQITKNISYQKVSNLYELIGKYQDIYIKNNVYEENKKILDNLIISFFIGEKFSQTDISKLPIIDIKEFILEHHDSIIRINTDNLNCKKWQKIWFKRLQYFTMKNKAHYFIKFMRFYRNVLPKFIRKKFYY